MEKVFDETFAGGKNKKKKQRKKKTTADRTGQDREEVQAAVCYRVGGRMGSIPARLGSVRSCLAQRVLSLASRLASGHGGERSLPICLQRVTFLAGKKKKEKEKEKEKEKKENFSLSLSVTLIRIVFILQSLLPCQFLKVILVVFRSYEEVGLDVRVR